MTKLQSAWMQANAPLAARQMLRQTGFWSCVDMASFLQRENPNMFVLREMLRLLGSTRRARSKQGLIQCVVDEIWEVRMS